MRASLLIVEDEERLRLSLQDYFIQEGFNVSTADDGVVAQAMMENDLPEVIVLDVQLPSMDGLEVCRRIRQTVGERVGIIMISGIKRDVIDRVVGLEIGADVYLTKPFETRELLAQVRAILRRLRARHAGSAETGWLVVDELLRIHFERRMVQVGGKEVHLTRLEFDLLKILAERSGVPCGRSDLVD